MNEMFQLQFTFFAPIIWGIVVRVRTKIVIRLRKKFFDFFMKDVLRSYSTKRYLIKRPFNCFAYCNHKLLAEIFSLDVNLVL